GGRREVSPHHEMSQEPPHVGRSQFGGVPEAAETDEPLGPVDIGGFGAPAQVLEAQVGLQRLPEDGQVAGCAPGISRSVPMISWRTQKRSILPPIGTYLGGTGRRSGAPLALGELGMQTIHFTGGDRLAGQLAALGVAA